MKMKENSFATVQICWLAKAKFFTLRCDANCRVKFYELCDQISRRNRNRIWKYFSLFIWGPDGFESWKNGGRKSHDTLPLKQSGKVNQAELGTWQFCRDKVTMFSGHNVFCKCHFTIFVVDSPSRHWGLTIFLLFSGRLATLTLSRN